MAADVAAEEQFGPYLVYERLGVGGMATVHRALERGIEGFERMVALKRLLPHLAEDASFIKSFVREAKLASLLNHVNIVQIFELGRVGAEYFISMEYIDGKDIRRILRHARKVTGPPPLHITIGILLQLCEALDYAHGKTDDDGHPLGLVHRDVSPSNLLLTTAGHLKVIDFGIAKAQSSQLRTQTGRVKGKLAYMAPEAIAGKDLDSRSDVFAAGVIAHELLTARPLFASKNEYQTLLKVQRGDILAPSSYNPQCTPELDAIVLKALERDPDTRYPSASAMRDDLLELRRRMGVATGYREIASWVEWAFAIDAPSGAFSLDHTGGPSRSTGVRTPTPTPRPRRDDEEAVEIAWGGGEPDDAGPVLLDDVPDVSERHAATLEPSSLESSGLDDIPTPLPSHGHHPRALTSRPELAIEDLDEAPVRKSPVPPARKSATLPPAVSLSPVVPLTERKKAVTMPPIPSVPSPIGRMSPTVPPTLRTPTQVTVAVPEDMADPTSRTMAAPEDTDESDAVDVDMDNDEAAHPADTLPTMTPRSTPVPRGSDPALAARTTPMPHGSDPALAPRTTPVPHGTDPALAPRTTPVPPADPAAPRGSSPGLPPPARITSPMETPRRPSAPLDAPALRPSVPLDAPALRPSEPHARTSAPLDSPALRPSAPSLEVEIGRIPRTKPGLQPARARTSQQPMPAVDGEEPTTQRRSRAAPAVTIGAAIVERELKPRNGWVVLVGIVFLGIAATGITLYATRGDDTVAAVPEEPHSPTGKPGTVKFDCEPADSQIRIEGQDEHAGSPWQTQLDPGIHQIEFHRKGYKAWLTSVDVTSNQTQIMRVVLEPLGNAITAEATLILSPSPSGLEAVLDGQVLAVRTPIRMPIAVGTHTIALRRNGADVWQQRVTAAASVDYAFSPMIDKPREREREVEPARPEPRHEQARPAPEPEPVVIAPPPKPVEPQRVDPPPPPPPLPVVIDAGVPVASEPEHQGPLLVAPTAVTKLSGETPNLGIAKNVDVPPVVAAKVCIDPAGAVTSATIINKLEHHANADLVDAIRTWRYAPYKQHGSPLAACFVVSFRVK